MEQRNTWAIVSSNERYKKRCELSPAWQSPIRESNLCTFIEESMWEFCNKYFLYLKIIHVFFYLNGEMMILLWNNLRFVFSLPLWFSFSIFSLSLSYWPYPAWCPEKQNSSTSFPACFNLIFSLTSLQIMQQERER